ncbi:MAG: protein kinase [Chloroflexota bacterium]|nr:protein kinase [Chloroflexota bacterium]
MSSLAGSIIKSYELRELVGAGGFGAVYRAHQPVIEREVAVKVIWPVFANQPNFIRRFETEAQVVAGLEHPHIVPLYDFWREPEGAYLVMRYLRGGHLRRMIQQGARTLNETGRIVGQIAAALALAHRSGIVHRDLKPENILLDEEGNAYLSDFGIAQIFSGIQDTDDEFGSMGSPAYAAPEQIAGDVTTPRADIYSLGIILYELVTGRHPFPDIEDMSYTEVLRRRRVERVPSLMLVRPDLPAELDDVIQRAAALDPSLRYPDALSMARALQTSLSNVRAEAIAVESIFQTSEMELVPNPYKGLRAFQESDAANFFGRDALVRQLTNRLNEPSDASRFLALIGPSGSGKSSVVKAGLIPALKRGALTGSDRWYFVEMNPGAQPFKELREALVSVATKPPDDIEERLERSKRGLLDVVNQILADDSGELFLFIDQFEEIFTLSEKEADSARFLNSLFTAVTEPGSRLRLVVTLRADFYDRPLLYPNFSQLMRKRTEVIVPMSAEELEQVISAPARRSGVTLETGLVAAITAEVTEHLGALPLLQYTLSEMFEHRQGKLLTVAAYRQLGGVRGSLARRAEEIHTQFSPQQQEAARQIFLRLIALGEGTEDTRRRAMLPELTSITTETQNVNAVLDALGKSRLLTFDRDPITRNPTVEVTHEAIIREWTRLRTWLDAARGDVRFQRTLAQLAGEWYESGQDASFLLRGARLEQLERWSETTTLALTRDESDFLRASIAERQIRQTQELQRQDRETALERRARTRLQLLVTFMAIMTVIALVLSGFAFTQSQIAQQERDSAEIARATSDASAVVSRSLALEAGARQALNDGKGDLALLLALEANNIPQPPIQSRQALTEIAFAPGTRRTFIGHTSDVTSVDLSPDTIHIVSASTDSTVRLWNTEDGTEIRQYIGHRGDVQSVAFNPDGTRIVSGASDFVAIVWDVETGAEIMRLTEHTAPVWSVAFSPNGTQIVTASKDGTLILWDAATGALVRRFDGQGASILSVAFSADGQFLLSGTEAGSIILWNANTGELLRRFTGHTTTVQDVTFSPDGLTALSASGDTTVLLWDIATGEIVRRYESRSGAVTSVTFLPNGRQLLSATVDGGLHLWDVDSGAETHRLQEHTNGITSVTISRDGTRAVTGSIDRTLRLWNISDGREAQIFVGHTRRISDIAFSADGTRIFAASADGSFRAWNSSDSTETQNLIIAPNALRSMAITPSGDRGYFGTSDGDILIWDLNQGREIGRLSGHDDAVQTLALDRSGTRLLSGAQNGDMFLWDIPNATILSRLLGHSGAIFSVEFNADGSAALSGSTEGELFLWNLETGDIAERFAGHTGSVFDVAFSPDGRTALSGSQDGSVMLWNIEGRALQARLLGHAAPVLSVAFSPNGHAAVSGSVDASMIVWDVSARARAQQFDNLGATVFEVAFSPNSDSVLSGQEFGILRLWRADETPNVIAWARENRYIRDFTCIEREQFRIQPLCL